MDRIQATNEALLELAEHLQDKTVLRLLRNALGREARRVRREASKALRPQARHGKELAKTIGAKVHRDLSGYTVFTVNRGKRYMYRNKPVLFFLTRGAENRRTKKGYSRGSLQGLDYMERTMRTESPRSGKALVTAYAQGVDKLLKRAKIQIR